MMVPTINPTWQVPETIRGFATTRRGGVSRAEYASLNLSDRGADQADQVRENLRRLESMLPGTVPWLRQEHGCRVVSFENAAAGDNRADAVFSDCPGQVCAVLTADCLPILLCNSQGTEIAAVHAGWRGLAAGVLESAVDRFSSAEDTIQAWLGPAIGPNAFEVGEDVYQAFVGQCAEDRAAFAVQGNRWYADLYRLARLRLKRVGLERVCGGEYCTYHDVERFYSYRRDKTTGRMATLIWIQE